MADHIPDAGQMVPDRCEPPEHLRNVDGWHWIVSDGKEVAMFWQSTDCEWSYGNDDLHPEMVCQYGGVYHSPVATPAEVEALRAERDAAIARDRNASAAHATRATDLWLVTEERDNLRAGTDRLIAERITLRARVAELEAALRRIVDGDHPEGTSLAVNGNYRELSARFQATARAALAGNTDV